VIDCHTTQGYHVTEIGIAKRSIVVQALVRRRDAHERHISHRIRLINRHGHDAVKGHAQLKQGCPGDERHYKPRLWRRLANALDRSGVNVVIVIVRPKDQVGIGDIFRGQRRQEMARVGIRATACVLFQEVGQIGIQVDDTVATFDDKPALAGVPQGNAAGRQPGAVDFGD
jgi:hypothetical protein